MLKLNSFIIIILLLTGLNSFCQNNISQATAEALRQYDQTRFDSVARQLNYKGGDQIKVYTKFKVDQNGNLVDIEARGPHTVFETEAIRVLKQVKLDTMNFGSSGKSQLFAMPIIFKIETVHEKKRRLRKEAKAKLRND